MSAAGGGLRPLRHTFDHGLVVLARRTDGSPAVSFSLSVAAGSAFDPPGEPGLAHFLSRVLDRGSEHRSGDEIADLLDSAGVTLATAVSRHQCTVSCTCLADDFPRLLALTAEIARWPALPSDEIEARRAEIVTGLRQDADSPAVVAFERLLERLYGGDHPYGRRAKGTPETVGRVARADLAAFHADRFGPRGACLVVVGDVDEHRAVDEAARAFDGWTGGPPSGTEKSGAVPPPPPCSGRTRLDVTMPGKAQADIAYGFVTLARSDPAYYDLWIANNVFGQYGLGGRIADSIRERQGMAYYAFSQFDANRGEGPLVVRAGVDPANVERAIAAVDEEVDRLVADGITARELADTQQFLTGSIPRTLETNANIAQFLQAAEFHALGDDYDLRLPGLIAAVTRDGALEAARRFLAAGRATIVVAGPQAPAAP